MKRVDWNINAGAILLYALMYFFDDIGLTAALIPAVLLHELGHAVGYMLALIDR